MASELGPIVENEQSVFSPGTSMESLSTAGRPDHADYTGRTAPRNSNVWTDRVGPEDGSGVPSLSTLAADTGARSL
nr:hypothetical protein BaRGS_016372 [Batillaria attramentaria]